MSNCKVLISFFQQINSNNTHYSIAHEYRSSPYGKTSNSVSWGSNRDYCYALPFHSEITDMEP